MRHGKSPRTRRRTSRGPRPTGYFPPLPTLSGCVGHASFLTESGTGNTFFVTKPLMHAGRFRGQKR